MHIILERQMREWIKVYKALSDISRLRAFNLILEKECCVCEVMQILEISQSKASRILSILHDAGFFKLRKDGLWSYYSMDWDGMNEVSKGIVEATRKALQGDKQMKINITRLKKYKREGIDCTGKSCLAQGKTEA
jgi:ArsR family transcriptional regulator